MVDLQLASSITGYMSILCWIIVFIPQLVENYRLKSGKGLSKSFLVIWLAGDFFNLMGIIAEDLLLTMFLLALWYTVADIGLIWQVYYYERRSDSRGKANRRRASGYNDEDADDVQLLVGHRRMSSEADALIEDWLPEDRSKSWTSMDWIGLSSIILTTVLSCYLYFANHHQHGSDGSNNGDETWAVIPQLLGWTSAILYIGSRIPQIVKNHRRQSTEGLTSGMLICAVLGNVLFTMSIFLRSTETSYILKNLAWIAGSIGTLVFDFTIFLQFFLYNAFRKSKRQAD
ncbi:PQ loop repeat-domain-containing protein [Radiomyces spectabilis]|uniref:PQ loop repeat-domain-containing protein n=1 Tax=Radiomyces spectabilis TaxID=64574 RepID=UPI0022211185|nr:PQ loop repeat-domain-containing protein [Radiomyces spectabilis]KAI8384314.1 PQ loop repeat-domain-containing protein [Radiomyces spectabilis]